MIVSEEERDPALDAFHHAARVGDTHTITKLISLGNLDLMFKSGEEQNTAMHWAAQFGHLNVIELLLSLGCDPTVQNSSGKTPLQLAKSLTNPPPLLVPILWKAQNTVFTSAAQKESLDKPQKVDEEDPESDNEKFLEESDVELESGITIENSRLETYDAGDSDYSISSYELDLL